MKEIPSVDWHGLVNCGVDRSCQKGFDALIGECDAAEFSTRNRAGDCP